MNFSSKEAQAAHPCFVLAPQTTIRWVDDALVNVKAIVDDLIANYNVDASRIYCIGCSMGGSGTRNLAQAYPEMLAAAVPIANKPYDDSSDAGEDRSLYEGLPMLFITSADDGVSSNESLPEDQRTVEASMTLAAELFESLGMTTYVSVGDDALNGYLRGELAANEMQAVLDAAAEAGADKIFITYLAGTVEPAAHSSWMPATANTALRDWMFAQVNDAPYAG